jgi:hypothetical protein
VRIVRRCGRARGDDQELGGVTGSRRAPSSSYGHAKLRSASGCWPGQHPASAPPNGRTAASVRPTSS